MILCSYLTQGQSSITPWTDSGVRLTDKGFLLPKTTFVKYDFWARKGIECSKSLTESIALVDQIAKAKIQSDSVSIVLNKTLWNVKDEVNLEKQNKARVEGINLTLNQRITEQDKEISTLRKNLLWTVSSAIGILVGTIIILK